MCVCISHAIKCVSSVTCVFVCVCVCAYVRVRAHTVSILSVVVLFVISFLQKCYGRLEMSSIV